MFRCLRPGAGAGRSPTKPRAKASGDWRIEVEGIAAHAGVDFEKGANAIRELARVIEKVSAWTDLKRGLTVSVGVAGGGTKTNVIPAHAWAEVDARIARAADGTAHRAQIRRSQSARPALHAHRHRRHQPSAHGAQPRNRPPLPRGSVAWLASSASRSSEASTGGGSDGNFTAALGIPTLDGMGAVGEGAHARHESVFIEHLAPRTALLAAMLMK